MEVLVCAKHVPETAEADLEIVGDNLSVDEDDLVFDINEWDLYAVEAALRLVEEAGGSVTVLTMGDEEAEDTLRKAMAMGCEEGVHITDEGLPSGDGHAKALALAGVAAQKPYDLILCGVQASDDGYSWTGQALASRLGLPHTTMVTSIVRQDGGLLVKRELEGGMEEELQMPLPCLLTIQTGINEPRYVSVMGIRKVRKKPITVIDAATLGTPDFDGYRLKNIGLRQPETGGMVELIEGAPSQQAERLAGILLEKGGAK